MVVSRGNYPQMAFFFGLGELIIKNQPIIWSQFGPWQNMPRARWENHLSHVRTVPNTGGWEKTTQKSLISGMDSKTQFPEHLRILPDHEKMISWKNMRFHECWCFNMVSSRLRSIIFELLLHHPRPFTDQVVSLSTSSWVIKCPHWTSPNH